MKKKILVIFEEYLYQRRGFFNAVIGRTKSLVRNGDCSVDVLLLTVYEPWLVRKFKHTPKQERIESVEIDGVKIRVDWRRFSFVDYFLYYFLHWPEFFRAIHNRKIARSLPHYDLIVAHSLQGGEVAELVKKSTGTPYTVTWHGSDIHTKPFASKAVFKATRDLIEAADMNFFVSRTLLRTSGRITPNGVKEVLYNGYNPIFRRFTDADRAALRKKWGVEDRKVVAFAGNFFAVKNPLAVPRIFRAVFEKFTNVEFWLIGDGKFRQQMEALSEGLPARFWGGQNPDKMPEFFNAADVVILPSINEGLPLAVVEALACGCNVVGSLVGGIPEVIGEENCVPLASGESVHTDPSENSVQVPDDDFVRKFAEKVLRYLTATTHIAQPLNPEFSWDATSRREIAFIETILRGR